MQSRQLKSSSSLDLSLDDDDDEDSFRLDDDDDDGSVDLDDDDDEKGMNGDSIDLDDDDDADDDMLMMDIASIRRLLDLGSDPHSTSHAHARSSHTDRNTLSPVHELEKPDDSADADANFV
jgi:hypothetical protein